MQEYCIQNFIETCLWYLLDWSDSYKYIKHMFYEKIRINQDFSFISIWSLSILYNSKFVLIATSLGTNAVVVTRVHCTFSHAACHISYAQNIRELHADKLHGYVYTMNAIRIAHNGINLIYCVSISTWEDNCDFIVAFLHTIPLHKWVQLYARNDNKPVSCIVEPF